jgi:hypothetical protein
MSRSLVTYTLLCTVYHCMQAQKHWLLALLRCGVVAAAGAGQVGMGSGPPATRSLPAMPPCCTSNSNPGS